jgi:hypothetical protein
MYVLCVCVCMYVVLCAYVCMYVLCVCMYVLYVCMYYYVCMYVLCVYVCMYVLCVYVCMCVCMYVRVCMYVYICCIQQATFNSLTPVQHDNQHPQDQVLTYCCLSLTIRTHHNFSVNITVNTFHTVTLCSTFILF